MRSAEILKQINAIPELKLQYLKSLKLSGQVNETKNGKLWRTHKVKKGVDHYKIWNLKDKVIKTGVSK